ncbi:hypothetical protein PENSUB_2034 [Penicillium subrubescens]|uniref:Reverse transcriptase Ty1/copia-type domain-containing protein n=1 Tax=Penicillium subrubescens TaxID=1316194 RepID=A0A1Q5UIH9_9EURO|nr:hypothetical protein PENSUB_2034 [Penicillium subrubescens]
MRETCDTEQQDSDDIKAGQPVVEGSRKGVKFGLSAYCDHALPALRLKPNSTSRAKYHEAKIEELKSHEEKGTWKVVPLSKITRHKARLLGRGFQQEEGLDYEETFASVVKPASTNAAPAKPPLDKNIKLAKQDNYIADTKFRREYQSKVGSLNFSGNQTRPVIAFATGYVARYASNPNQTHMDAVDRIFAYLKGDPRKGIVYSDKYDLQLMGFVDSDFAGCED